MDRISNIEPPQIRIIKPNKQNHSFTCVLQDIHVVGVEIEGYNYSINGAVIL